MRNRGVTPFQDAGWGHADRRPADQAAHVVVAGVGRVAPRREAVDYQVAQLQRRVRANNDRPRQPPKVHCGGVTVDCPPHRPVRCKYLGLGLGGIKRQPCLHSWFRASHWAGLLRDVHSRPTLGASLARSHQGTKQACTWAPEPVPAAAAQTATTARQVGWQTAPERIVTYRPPCKSAGCSQSVSTRGSLPPPICQHNTQPILNTRLVHRTGAETRHPASTANFLKQAEHSHSGR